MRLATCSEIDRRSSTGPPRSADARAAFIRLTAIVFFTTAVSSLVFQSTTFALPKVFDEFYPVGAATRRAAIGIELEPPCRRHVALHGLVDQLLAAAIVQHLPVEAAGLERQREHAVLHAQRRRVLEHRAQHPCAS